VIAGLAAQTNMLAMNAAIEAAHAGDAGRGFSVVAEEIRNLAESASRNAKQSSDFLKNVVEEIEKTNETIQGVQSSFAKVDEESRSVVESLSEIVSASQEMSETSRGIRRQMEQLQQINREVVEGANQISEGVSDINKADQQSKSVAEEVRDKSAEITESMNKLVRSADQIAEIAGSLHTGAGNVLEELRRFTVNTRREAG
jgi:methyl-accepting chemotaxis protein